MNTFKIQYRLIAGGPKHTVTLFAKTESDAIAKIYDTGIYFSITCVPV